MGKGITMKKTFIVFNLIVLLFHGSLAFAKDELSAVLEGIKGNMATSRAQYRLYP